MIVILKFFKNEKRPELDTVISRTLRKVAVVSKNYAAKTEITPTSVINPLPQDKELWKCRIVKETHAGEAKGCFIVDPIERIEHESTRNLIPNGFSSQVIGGRLILTPTTPGNWMLDLMHKNLLTEKEHAYCVIVDLEGFPTEMTIPQSGRTET